MTWTSLKEKLTKLIFLSKHKELLKDALQTHLNQSSSFLTHHSNLEIINTESRIRSLTQEIESFDQTFEYLNHELNQTNNQEYKEELKRRVTEARSKKNSLNNQLANLKNLLKPESPTIQAFERQKEKNERIVKECKEMLDILKA